MRSEQVDDLHPEAAQPAQRSPDEEASETAMAPLLYKEDFDEARTRLEKWWRGEDIGRPAMLMHVARKTPIENVPAMPPPPGWLTDYSTSNFEYRVYCARRACLGVDYMAEAIPSVAPDLAPNCLALYLGCRGVEAPATVWCEPCIESPETARFRREPGNFYWDFTLRLAREQLRLGAGKFLVAFPDLIEGLDTLAAMRGTQTLLMDLIERPAWVRDALAQITDRYFEAYDVLYDMMKDDRGGSHHWAWAPGRMSKLQCDFSAMISPAAFGEFMVPVLTRMTERLDHCMYHWDGPGALPHHDHLLSIPRLEMLQWTPGAGAAPIMDRRWWPYYHKTLEAGKRMALWGVSGRDDLLALKKEFKGHFKSFLIVLWVSTPEDAEGLLAAASD
jgi:5-methyltetrahydrofolate--homocysteine methyltransferase